MREITTCQKKFPRGKKLLILSSKNARKTSIYKRMILVRNWKKCFGFWFCWHLFALLFFSLFEKMFRLIRIWSDLIISYSDFMLLPLVQNSASSSSHIITINTMLKIYWCKSPTIPIGGIFKKHFCDKFRQSTLTESSTNQNRKHNKLT